ncbi:MAG: hypothetical protein ABJC39_07185 [Chloroflexota bacterium]
MGIVVEQFRVSADRTETEAACLRALRAPGWEVQASDRVEFQVPVGHLSDNLLVVAIQAILEELPPTRRLLHRLTTLSSTAPAPQAGADSTFTVAWQGIVAARVSLREVGAWGTDVTISSSAHARDGNIRSAIRDLRRSIEIDSGSLHPYQTPT